MDQCKAFINFKTQQENNVRLFRIEHSSNGFNWNIVSVINSKGTGSNEYRITDNGPSTGRNYYRVQELGMDGRYSYTNIVSGDNACTIENKVIVYPNPVQGQLTIITRQEAKVLTITLTDVMGNTVLQTMRSDRHTTIDMSSIPSGVYFLKLDYDNGQGYSKTIIRQ